MHDISAQELLFTVDTDTNSSLRFTRKSQRRPSDLGSVNFVKETPKSQKACV